MNKLLRTDNIRTLALTAMAAFAADQVTKMLVWAEGSRFLSRTLIPGFLDLVHVQNRGAAFGFLNRSDIDWQIWLFAAVTMLAIGIIFNIVRHAPPQSRLLSISLGLVLGGALGNMLDRVRLRSVTDFIDFHIGQYHWPAFNIADTAICCGAVIVCVILWKTPSQK